MAGTGSRAGPSSYHLLAVPKKWIWANLGSLAFNSCLLANFTNAWKASIVISLDF
jgi:hypothetical protein